MVTLSENPHAFCAYLPWNSLNMYNIKKFKEKIKHVLFSIYFLLKYDSLWYFSKAFDLVPHDRLLTKIAASGMESRVVIWIREFLLGRTQRVRVGGHLSEEVGVTSRVPQWSVLGPLLFLAYVNDIWRNTDSTIRLFADDCIIYREVKNNNDKETYRLIWTDLGNWRLKMQWKLIRLKVR
jgi:hypothetical protein